MRLFPWQIVRSTKRSDKDNLYILRNQLMYNQKDLIDFLPSECPDCKSNDMYRIWIEEEFGLGSQGKNLIIWVRCINCSDSYTIPYKSYKRILPILKLNIKRDLNKIDPSLYESKVTQYQAKLYKKIDKDYLI